MIPSNRTTTIEWPEALGCPLVSSYGAEAMAPFDRTAIDAAPPAYFRFRYHERRSFAMEFLWTLAQLETFDDFRKTTLNNGLRWFMMAQLADVRQNKLFCHLAGGYRLVPQQDRTIARELVRVSFDVIGFWRSA